MRLVLPLDIPSPTTSVWYLGPVPIRGYAMCILLGIVAAAWIAGRRLVPRGGTPGQALDVAAWAVPFGIVGGRIYHVITTPQPYFGEGGNPAGVVRIWEGGLGIWGAISLGALGAYIGCRRSGVDFRDFADALAPGLLVAQAIGRFGNWFNNEIHGSETSLPWGLVIHEWDQAAGRAVVDASGQPVVLGVFHPTFLYEADLVPAARGSRCWSSSGADRCTPGSCSPCTSWATPLDGSSSSSCAPMTPTTSSGCGSTSGCRCSSSCWACGSTGVRRRWQRKTDAGELTA